MINKFNKLFWFSPPVVLPALLFVSPGAMAAGHYYDARNDAMGGTGVASSTYGSAVLANPALMTKSQPQDEISIILPAVGAQISDKDKLVDKVDDIADTVDRYKSMLDNFTFADIPRLRAASGDLANRLRDIRGDKAWGQAGAALAVTVPNDRLPFAFVTKAYGTAYGTSNISQHDIDLLQGIANATAFPSFQDKLTSTGLGRAAIVYDFGIAMAHEFDIGGHPFSFGVTPKLQKTTLYNYSASVYSYKRSDLTNDKYKNTHTDFNLDLGAATDLGDNWTLGLSGQNLIAHNLDTKEVNGYRDTYQIRPLVTSGVSFHTERLTTALDIDLTPTKRFKIQQDSQYAGIGAEYRLLEWLQLRGGYRADMKSNDTNVFTGGVGISPYKKVHLDLAGMVGKDKTWGAVAQLNFTF
ncbi:conjugal transfer protein TraF [Erwinia tasmaniensis]|uniref:Plasmid transfer protein TraF n=1 Tax=Erwinia tasmaniensis (strain DSM 17950 / CFBP 7177 / CIP 109463 / NCPPB 4357 / Et1/99) TaxID=465817 RepID=B2VK98_ERWT9|nr:conjugal transfer protein TraF [Erwinia tasmaniensis]CAO98144.1 Putative plasmid transfer protein TraF [Erwinia tasmaniensis Et1/99]